MQPNEFEQKEYEVMEMPVGGIANFYFTDIDEHDDDDVDDYIYGPQAGIGNLKSVAEKLAEHGRGNDDHMVHTESGEFVVPVQIQKENPELVAKLKAAIAEYGVNPEQYVVGSDFNSINPATGQPEFIFKALKKLGRKIKKGLKKVVSGVKKVVKKIGKVLKPIAKPLITMGLTILSGGAINPITAGFLGGGIGGLIQGESLGDALKSGVKGAFTAGITSGVTGAVKAMFNPNITVAQGFTSGVRDAFGTSGFTSSVAEKIMPNVPTSAERLMMIENPGMTAQMAEKVTAYKNTNAYKAYADQPEVQAALADNAKRQVLQDAGVVGVDTMRGELLEQTLQNTPGALEKYAKLTDAASATGIEADPTALMRQAIQTTATNTPSGFNMPQIAGDAAGQAAGQAAGGMSTLGKIGLAASVGLPLVGAAMGAFNPVEGDEQAVLDQQFDEVTDEDIEDVSVGVVEDEEYVEPANVEPTPVTVGQPTYSDTTGGYQPLVGVGVGQPGTQPQFVDYDGTTVGPQTAFNPDLMGSFNNNIYYPSQYQTIPGYNPQITGMSPAPFYGYDEYGRPIYSYYGTPDVRQANFVPGAGPDGGQAAQQFVTAQDVQMAAVGGPMTTDNFPRRSGMIQGPGTETSDDIPAMLSDGEFVMTARAVRGAGGGDRQAGFRKMYDIMRAFEGGAVA